MVQEKDFKHKFHEMRVTWLQSVIAYVIANCLINIES